MSAAEGSNNERRVPAAAGGRDDVNNQAVASWPPDLGEAAAKAAHDAEATRKELEHLRQQAASLNAEYQRQSAIAKALQNQQRATPAPPAPVQAPTAGKRKKNAPIAAEVKALIAENIIE